MGCGGSKTKEDKLIQEKKVAKQAQDSQKINETVNKIIENMWS